MNALDQIMAFDRYSTSRRAAQMDSATKGRVADLERAREQDALRNGLGHLTRIIRAAGSNQVMEDGTAVTYLGARAVYSGLLTMVHNVRVLSVDDAFADLRGAALHFPETQRPLLIRHRGDAQVLGERYGLDPESYGRDAANALFGIACGDVRGRTEFVGEPTPIPAVVRIAHDTFKPDTARNIVIGAIEERKKRIKAGPAVYVVWDREALMQLVGALSLSSGEQVVQSLSSVMEFAHQQRDAELLARGAFTLEQFADDPGNRAAIVPQIEGLQRIFADLPDGLLGKRILAPLLQGFAG